MPLLVGTDGTEKMSKSYDNYIGISDTPQDIFGKTLSIPDSLIYNYYELATDVSKEDLSQVKSDLENHEVNPRNVKRSLALKLAEMYHSHEAAVQAQEEFDNIFINKGIPDDIPEFIVSINEISISDLIVDSGCAPSKAEAKRLIKQGGVTLDGEKISDPSANIEIKNGQILKVGKRKFVKLVL